MRQHSLNTLNPSTPTPNTSGLQHQRSYRRLPLGLALPTVLGGLQREPETQLDLSRV